MRNDRLERLVARARKEQPPRVDVTDRVMLRIRDTAPAPMSLRPFVWVASAALALALPLAIAVPYALRAWEHPLVQMFAQVGRGLP